jgi:transcriptional regulator of arginine metabolism
MSRHFRQAKILELIENSPIETQEEITSLLKNFDFKVTQATVSRDIKDLGLIKMPYGERWRYVRDSDKSIMHNKVKEIFRIAIIKYEQVGNTIVFNTLQGMANAASVMIEQLNFEGVVGNLSGWDTVFVLMRTVEQGNQLIQRVEQILNS